MLDEKLMLRNIHFDLRDLVPDLVGEVIQFQENLYMGDAVMKICEFVQSFVHVMNQCGICVKVHGMNLCVHILGV
jgi:hypothetical protein